MKRYRIDFSYGRYFFDERDDGDWVRFEDHEAIIKRQASAALTGMNAAKAISSHDLQRAARLRAESSPDALESERQANALLTAENERLRKALSARLQELERIKQKRLDWAMLCDHDCPACTELDDAIRGDVPQTG